MSAAPPTTLTDAEVAAFRHDGFVILRNFFSPEEIALIGEAMRRDAHINDRAYGLADGEGGATTIALWNHVGDDTVGLVPRLERMVSTAERLLEGEVYHYHSKVTTKAPGGGGTWDWHQDYGYWYKNGCLAPDMLSVAIAVGPQTVENGCLRMLKGSDHCGRVEHYIYGHQTAADADRVEQIGRRHPTIHFEADAGDVCFFHCNTLHSSAPNHSDGPREMLLVAYNAAANDPVIEHHHPRYTPLDRVADSRLLETGLVLAGAQRVFLDPRNDLSIGSFQPAPRNSN